MRKFAINNEQGVCWDLNGAAGVIFSSPEGLGARWKIATADLGHGFYAELPVDTVPAEPVVGELKFLPPDAYATYRAFVTFLTGSDKLILNYCPYGPDTFLCRGRFEFLQKGELDKNQILTVPVSFATFTPWYAPTDLELVLKAAEEDDTTFPFVLGASTFPSSSVGSWAAEISPAGDQPASLVFHYEGSVEDPVLVLTGADSGTEYGRCAVSGTFTDLHFSSQWLDSYVRDGSGADLLDDVSPGADPFFRAPVSEPCVLSFSASNELSGSATVAVNYFFRSV